VDLCAVPERFFHTNADRDTGDPDSHPCDANGNSCYPDRDTGDPDGHPGHSYRHAGHADGDPGHSNRDGNRYPGNTDGHANGHEYTGYFHGHGR